jgi:succinate dehydrogenase / fumarate reductase, cytochrome b subunit
MTWKLFFTSSIGKKIIMGLTGLFLISFLVVHCLINAMIFFNDDGATFNEWAHFMGTNLIIRTMEIGLFAGLLLHIIQGLLLWKENNSKRPVKYAVQPGSATSKWYSRSMGLLGTLLLIFLIIHLAHFWTHSRFGGMMGIEELASVDLPSGKAGENMYALMQEEFSELWVVIVYVLAMASLAYHLLHGFQSAFQTFGLNHKRYTPLIKVLGAAFSYLIPLIFALMPVLMYLKVIR